MDRPFYFFMGFMTCLIVICLLLISAIAGTTSPHIDDTIIKSDHPITPQKEIKVDSNGDSTFTYIYKL